MLTYQDLLEVGDSDDQRMDFVRHAIYEHKSSEAYKYAEDAFAYYTGLNPTIMRYEKILYDMAGRAHVDMWTANHKLTSHFFGRVVDQDVDYLLGNGVLFANDSTAEKLGKNFDYDIARLARFAKVGGVSFGFYDHDHVRAYRITEFVPFYDEETGALKAGVYFWQVSPEKPLRATLFELDGMTDYIWREEESGEVLHEKRAYTEIRTKYEAEDMEIVDGKNYPSFPVVPLKNNDDGKSELCGRRNTIDALDIAESEMINRVDEGNLIYWVLTNCNGMDDIDDAQFIERLKTTKVVHADGDAAASAVPHTIEAPYGGTQATIDMLYRKLYTDFQCFDSAAVSAGQQTATAIQATYVPLDLKTGKFEEYVTRFITGILEVAGIDDYPTYTRNRLINKAEEINTLIAAAQFTGEEYTTKKILTVLGDPDLFDEVQEAKMEQAMQMMQMQAAMQGGEGAEQGPETEVEPTEEETPEEQ